MALHCSAVMLGVCLGGMSSRATTEDPCLWTSIEDPVARSLPAVETLSDVAVASVSFVVACVSFVLRSASSTTTGSAAFSSVEPTFTLVWNRPDTSAGQLPGMPLSQPSTLVRDAMARNPNIKMKWRIILEFLCIIAFGR